jgi:transcriptional regulator with XRE-family HTH domain
MRKAKHIRKNNSKTRKSTVVDHHVGIKIRDTRQNMSMSQTALAQACGITFQQIQKYENGGNRVSASRLWQLAAIFNVSIDYFFEGLASHHLDSKTIKLIETGTKDKVGRNSQISENDLQLARLIATHPDKALIKSAKMMLNAAQF